MTSTLIIPTVETERLRLRAPKPEDFEAIFAFYSSDAASTVGGPFDETGAFQRLVSLHGHWAMRGFGRWLVADNETDAALGIAGPYYPPHWPEPEIAWTVFASAVGRGIAFEAAQAARSYAYDTLGWSTAISCVDDTNTRSVALAKRLGCRREDSFAHPVYGPLTVWRHPDPNTIPSERTAP